MEARSPGHGEAVPPQDRALGDLGGKTKPEPRWEGVFKESALWASHTMGYYPALKWNKF